MALRITPQFKSSDILDFVRRRIEALEEVVLDQLKDCGEQFVADARSVNTYTDRTGNLRASIGYVIAKDGREIFGNFQGIASGTSVGKRKIRQILGSNSKGFVLIVVAGMEYAAAVESKGYDVITGSSLSADSFMSRQIDRLRQQLKKLK
jgi:hypothetical protein